MLLACPLCGLCCMLLTAALLCSSWCVRFVSLEVVCLHASTAVVHTFTSPRPSNPEGAWLNMQTHCCCWLCLHCCPSPPPPRSQLSASGDVNTYFSASLVKPTSIRENSFSLLSNACLAQSRRLFRLLISSPFRCVHLLTSDTHHSLLWCL